MHDRLSFMRLEAGNRCISFRSGLDGLECSPGEDRLQRAGLVKRVYVSEKVGDTRHRTVTVV